MDSFSNSKARFTGIFGFGQDMVYVRALIRKLDEEGNNHTAMLRWKSGTWGQYMIPTATVAHCVTNESDRTILALAPDGMVHKATPLGFGWEQVDTTENRPNSLRMMADIKPIGNAVYAAGMARMVYRRSTGGTWMRADDGMRGSRSELAIGGFLSIDGHTEDLIYAVGFKGEMWYREERVWKQIESPTNVKLERVRAISGQTAVACGASGTILVGSKDNWKVVGQQVATRTLWGLEYYKGRVYLADSHAVYVLVEQELQAIDCGLGKDISFGRLHANEFYLWSVGENDILRFDGTKWEKIDI
jgi:hypothetical protein